VKEGTYSIYNRWGEKLAENPIDVAWNGRFADGSYVPEGAYAYKIKVVFDESVTGNRIIHQSGTVLVLAGDK
jgi:flagellar hook assembly protein FlgD